jgi:hypothetical protein
MKNLVLLPRDLLQNENHIWVIEDMHLQNRLLQVLKTEGKQVYVSGGLKAGEIINMSPLGSVFPGTAVEIVQYLEPAVVELENIRQIGHENALPALTPRTSKNIPEAHRETQMERLAQ